MADDFDDNDAPARVGSRSWAGSLLVLGAVAIVLVAVLMPPGSRKPVPQAVAPLHPASIALVSYSSCNDLLAGLRENTARNLSAIGNYPMLSSGSGAMNQAAVGSAAVPSAAPLSVPDHSTTNVQEAGVDEPDIVKTDGTRIITVQGGVLRVVDAATHQVTGTLTLTANAGGASEELLLSGNRVLVVLSSKSGPRPAGQIAPGAAISVPAVGSAVGSAAGSGAQAGPGPIAVPVPQQSRYVVVDISSTPKIISSLAAGGDFVDARMVGTTVRLVNSSTPAIELPNVYNPNISDSQRAAQVAAAVGRAPLSDWLPTYTVSTGRTSATRSVPCTSISHPASYTGTSLLTVYTIDLSKALADASPVTLAADGTTVYGTQHSLYIASTTSPGCCLSSGGDAVIGGVQPKVAPEQTEIHRFDLPAGGRPVYLGSATVPGRLLNQYSMSDFNGYLRLATTAGPAYYAGSGQQSTSSSAVYVLDDIALPLAGSVSGLGHGQQIYAVRFVGPLAYVVTFQLTDPLYVIDLTNPRSPRASGELELTGYSNYLQPVGDGRLVGVGQEANSQGRVAGMQVSLFDVSSPSVPRRVGHVLLADVPGESSFDPHSFLYWPATGMVVVPIDTWTNSPDAGKALVLRVEASGLITVGLIGHPGISQNYQPYAGIERTLVIGNSIWTMSSAGLLASSLSSLKDQTWIPFS